MSLEDFLKLYSTYKGKNMSERCFRESMMLKPAEDCFKQGWKEAIVGETRQVSELWNDAEL